MFSFPSHADVQNAEEPKAEEPMDQGGDQPPAADSVVTENMQVCVLRLLPAACVVANRIIVGY